MAKIVINEVSRNFNYSVGTSSFATVALPITAAWGPGYFDPEALMNDCRKLDTTKDWDAENHSDMLDRTVWQRFSANQAGLESFISTYRGPVANYRLANDFSYQMAMTLLTAGYDVLVCRLSPGAKSSGVFNVKTSQGVDTTKVVTVRAKYPGTFGNNLMVEFKNIAFMQSNSSGSKWSYYWNMIVYAVDISGTKNAVENKTFVFDIDDSTDAIPYWREIESDFVDLSVSGEIPDYEVIDPDTGETARISLVDANDTTKTYTTLVGGTDKGVTPGSSGASSLVGEAIVGESVVGGSNNSSTIGDATIGDSTIDASTSSIHDQKIALIQDAKKWAELRYRLKDEGDDSLNTGFTYNPIERNYILAFDYLLGDTATVVEAIASYMGIEPTDPRYQELENLIGQFSIDNVDLAKVEAIRFREWIFTHLVGILGRDGYEGVYDLLKDKLSYNPQRIISPGWDDQDFLYLLGQDDPIMICSNAWGIRATSPIHRKIMDVSYFSRCATGMLDIPRSLDKKDVYNAEEEDFIHQGYAQKLARYIPDSGVDMNLYHTHSALFTCWGRYTYTGIARQTIAPPAFLAIMIQRAMILNQSLQYEWILPTDRKQNLKIGKLDYDIPQKLLSVWQSSEGVGVNCITLIPGLGTTLWGNSTLYEVPPATYQALANLSTRYLVNAIEDVVYRTGVGITFQYNNGEAYASFQAGVTPILDTMRNSGAIEDYMIKMSLDINELDQVNANSVIGTIYVVIAGVIQNITVDLIALPPTTSLAQFA